MKFSVLRFTDNRGDSQWLPVTLKPKIYKKNNMNKKLNSVVCVGAILLAQSVCRAESYVDKVNVFLRTGGSAQE